ncbi:MAG: YegP family protein [Alphaproteobacteria bacterium]|nr:YegP family protein [Alphaproteobacteria bacterium]
MFEVFKATNGNFYWRLKSTNGEIICQSEGYTTKQNALNGIDAVKRIAVGAPIKDLT